ncbi:MAG: HAD-IA family hydrolase [Gammaproteobacteria bacterium]|nr:HAD-IA family hydrolase [Gammaproteobacteria bacterium]
MSLELVLFDLDGTLADTLPDLCWAVNTVLATRSGSHARVDEQLLRPVISDGSRAIVAAALGHARRLDPRAWPTTISEDDIDSIRTGFLDLYQANIDRHTRLFQQTPELLERLDAAGLRWGVVTNKLSRFAMPLINRLGLGERCACVVGGDTAPHPKPHPAPLLHACRLADAAPARSIYIGDAPGDVIAAHRAGMPAVVAQWGYLPVEPEARSWGAEHLAETPLAVAELLLGHAPGSNADHGDGGDHATRQR